MPGLTRLVVRRWRICYQTTYNLSAEVRIEYRHPVREAGVRKHWAASQLGTGPARKQPGAIAGLGSPAKAGHQ